MKLIFCPKCNDIFRLTGTCRKCECKNSYGYYVNNLCAVIGGDAIPLGIENSSFVAALRNRPEKTWGYNFEAFVIPKSCPTIRVDSDASENVPNRPKRIQKKV